MDEKLYTIREFTKIFNISRETFYNWKERGVFRPIQIGRTIRIAESEVKRIQAADEKLYSIKDFTKFFNISRDTFYNWKARDVVRPIQIGGTVRIADSEVKRIIASNTRTRILDDDLKVIKNTRSLSE